MTICLENYDFAGWVPCSNPLMFRFFHPSHPKNYSFNNLSPSLYANFSWYEGNERSTRKLCGFSFLANNDEGYVDEKELERFDGEFRYFFYAETKADQLKGKLLVISTKQLVPTTLVRELLESFQRLDELNKELTDAIGEGKAHEELGKIKKDLNDKFEPIKDLFTVLAAQPEDIVTLLTKAQEELNDLQASGEKDFSQLENIKNNLALRKGLFKKLTDLGTLLTKDQEELNSLAADWEKDPKRLEIIRKDLNNKIEPMKGLFTVLADQPENILTLLTKAQEELNGLAAGGEKGSSQLENIKNNLALRKGSFEKLTDLGSLLTKDQEELNDLAAGWEKDPKRLEIIRKDLSSKFESIKDKLFSVEDNCRVSPFEFVLSRDGVVVFKDLFSEVRKKEAYGEEAGINYTNTPRIYKMVYYFIKQSFHVHSNHEPSSDSMIGPFYCLRLKGSEIKDSDEAWKIFYEHQKNYLNQSLCKARRKTAVNKVSASGIAIYGKSLAEQIRGRLIHYKDYLDNEKCFWKMAHESVVHYEKRTTIEPSFFLLQKWTSGITWLIPFALLCVALYQLWLKLACGTDTTMTHEVKCWSVPIINRPIDSLGVAGMAGVLSLLLFLSARAMVLKKMQDVAIYVNIADSDERGYLSKFLNHFNLFNFPVLSRHWHESFIKDSIIEPTIRSRFYRKLRWRYGLDPLGRFIKRKYFFFVAFVLIFLVGEFIWYMTPNLFMLIVESTLKSFFYLAEQATTIYGLLRDKVTLIYNQWTAAKTQ